jgi:hypothetical protein
MNPPEQFPFKQVCIIGGGNAVHALDALLPSRGIRTVWYVPYGDEAEKINLELVKHGTISATFAPHNTPNGCVQGRPDIVSANARDVIPTSDVILFTVPSFVYAPILHEIRGHLQKEYLHRSDPGSRRVRLDCVRSFRGKLFRRRYLVSDYADAIQLSDYGIRSFGRGTNIQKTLSNRRSPRIQRKKKY